MTGSDPSVIADPKLKMPSEGSQIPGAGPIFLARIAKTDPEAPYLAGGTGDRGPECPGVMCQKGPGVFHYGGFDFYKLFLVQIQMRMFLLEIPQVLIITFRKPSLGSSRMIDRGRGACDARPSWIELCPPA